MSPQPVILLDRDGTIIVERHYLADPGGVELLPHAAAGLRRLVEGGYRLVVVTNQSGIARGKFTPAQLAAVHCRLEELLAAEGIELAGIYVCPHSPSDGCGCRKPGVALVDAAQRELGFRREECFVIGDKRSDVELGHAIGGRSVLVRTGYGHQATFGNSAGPDYVADDLWDAAEWIVAAG